MDVKENYTFNKLLDKQEYITGERLQSIANIYLGLPEDFRYNPKILDHTSKLLDISSINTPYDNPRIVFCYSHRLNILIEKINFFNNPFILISHNSDENIVERYEILLYSNKIIRWYAQNINIKHSKLHLLPIGIAKSMWQHGNLELLKQNILNLSKKTKDFYFYFNISTNSKERTNCREEIEKKGLVFGKECDINSYLNDLALHKFAICPPGNGIDCHRFWECYYLGVIPIALKSTFTEKLQELLPCVLLDKWSDFNKDSIIPQYNKLQTILCEKYNYLTFSYYKNTIESIKPKTVWFFPRGRSGNNIFQYLAAEVIKHIYNFDIVRLMPHIYGSLTEIDDIRYTQITSDYLSNPHMVFSSDNDIILNGFFQKSNILLHLRPILLKFINNINKSPINDKYNISDFNRNVTSHSINLDDDTLIIHFRLDDFYHSNNPPNIFDMVELSRMIDTIKFKKLYIVCDKINHNWEKKYIQYFIDKYNGIHLVGSLFDDFNLLKMAKRLVTSPSTFCWIAAYLGNATEVYIPYSDFYKEHQVLKECHENCSIYYDIPFSHNLNT